MDANNPYNPPRDPNDKVHSRSKSDSQLFSKTIGLIFLFAVIGGLSFRYFMSSYFRSIGDPSGRGISFGVGGLIGVGVCLCIMFFVKLASSQRDASHCEVDER